MNGIQISLTAKEREQLINAVTYYVDIMSEGFETSAFINEEMNNGLGRAMFKLYKGLQGEKLYENYKK